MKIRRLPILLGLSLLLFAARPAHAQVALQLFGDIDYVYARNPAGPPTSTFAIPTFDVFASGAQDRFSYLAELVFEADAANKFEADLERIELGYLFSNWLRLKVGRFHSAIGYYNDAYHHGAYYELTAGRPILVHFEDRGGLLPAHTIGLHADGRFVLGDVGDLRYDLELTNGRGATLGELANFADAQRSKAVNLRLRFSPAALDGLSVGVNGLYDRFSFTPEGGEARRFDELILGAHATYLAGQIHFIAEAALVTHVPVDDAGPTLRSFGAFAEVGYAFGDVEPYARYERVSYADQGDPLYASAPGSFHAVLAGAKWTVSANAALKAQLQRTFFDAGPASLRATVQASYGF